MIFVYNLLLNLLSPVLVFWAWLRAKKRDEQPNWAERFGHYDIKPGNKNRIWFHAVSVGEVMAALPVLRQLRERLPGVEIVLTTTTSSGHKTAREKAAGLYDHLFYFPIDFGRCMFRAVSRVLPGMVVVMETELWLNFFHFSKQMGAKVVVINGRISRNYNLSLKLKGYYRAIFERVDRIFAQSDLDKERLVALGAHDVQVLGNTKFDQAVEAMTAHHFDWRHLMGIPDSAVCIVVGSTRSEAEEHLVMNGLAKVPDAWVIYAPRHIERAPHVGDLAREHGFEPSFRTDEVHGKFLILDTYGELASAYSSADIAIIGGAFDELGGQNILQPMAAAVPVLHGPHMFNFKEAAALASQLGATRTVSSAEELGAALQELCNNADLRTKMGAAGKEMIEQSLGASGRYADVISRMMTPV